VTATVIGGTAAGANGSFSQSTIATATYPLVGSYAGATTNSNALLGVYGADLANGDSAATWYVKPGVATTVSAKIVTAAAAVAGSYTALVTDSAGLITGVSGAKYNVNVTKTLASQVAASSATLSVAIPATTTAAQAAAGTTIATMVIDKATDATITIQAQAAAAKYIYVNPAQDAATHSIRAGVASSNAFTATVTDQFGNVVPSVAVTGSITGRNSTTVVPALVTNASGQVSYTLPDTYTGAVALVDTLTFAVTGATSGVVTVNYAAYLPVATITMTTPDSTSATANGIAGLVKTDISSLDGAEAGAVDVTVVLKDANGATLPAGIPVTFSVAGTGVAILSTHVTVYTDASGAATSKVYGWVNGDRVVTATAGAVSASGTYYFRQLGTETETRTITAKATGNLVTATVTDRFGNPIAAAAVTATRVGTGTFNGTSSISGNTDANGVVEFVLTGGTADVTVGFSSTTYGQTAATKGYINAGITAILAYTAGTTALAEEGVGASFDAAGVNSVKVLAVTDTASVDAATAAADAAAEATDAANAATDAANAAAEAADAATAAAQDAADAVAALSTQVSEMVDALKKQITALTNLVIKIQKKVKA